MEMNLLKELELRVLGTIIKNKDTISLMDINAEHFSIYTNIYNAIQKGDFSLSSIAEKSGRTLEEIGKISKMATTDETLRDNIMSIKNHVAKQKYEDFLKAELERIKDVGNAAEIIDKSIEEIKKIPTETRTTSISMKSISDEYFAYIENWEEGNLKGLMTSIPKLNKVLGGFIKSTFSIIAARPGVGKTGFLTQAVLDTAGRGNKVLFVSLELPKVQVYERFISTVAGIDTDKQKAKDKTKDERKRIKEASELINSLPIEFSEQAKTVAQIHREIVTNQPDLVVIDQISIVDGQGKDIRERVISISNGLRDLAKTLDVAIVAANQINRAGEDAEELKMSHLAESTSLEQDAYSVLLMSYADLDRCRAITSSISEEEYAQEIKKGNRFIELNIAKNRQGRTGRILLIRDSATFRMMEYQPGIGGVQEYIEKFAELKH